MISICNEKVDHHHMLPDAAHAHAHVHAEASSFIGVVNILICFLKFKFNYIFYTKQFSFGLLFINIKFVLQ